MTTSDKVIAFPSAEPLPENPIAIEKPPSYNYCRHESVSLDEHNRVVNCVKCGAVLDPFNFLHENARTIQTAWDHHRQVMAKVHEIGERLQVLVKEEKRLKGRVRTLKEKVPVLDTRGKDRL